MNWAPLILSLKIGIICLILQLILGVLLGRYLANNKTFVTLLVDIIVTLPLVFPPIAIGFFLLQVFGKNGMVGKTLSLLGIEIIFSFTGLIIASFIAGLPLVVKPIQAAFESETKDMENVSYTLGKGKVYTFLFVSLPNIKATVISSLFLAFARSAGEVGITLIVGGNIVGRTETISLAIYNATLNGEYKTAAGFSAVLAIMAITIFILLRILKYKENKI